MLTELCQELHNWFDRNQGKWFGRFVIADGVLTFEGRHPVFSLKDGQYYRIVGSTFNDGVHQYPSSDLSDEEFEGAVWAMAVPPSVIALANEIEKWEEKYGGVDGIVNSPYSSESFGGYSYTKASARNNDLGDGNVSWQSVYEPSLRKWRKLP